MSATVLSFQRSSKCGGIMIGVQIMTVSWFTRSMICCGLLLTLLAVLHSSVQAQEVANTEASHSIGSRAPDFNLAEVFGGSAKSDDFRGKVIVIDFLATWCPP